ncbi:MAG: cell division protein SepF [Clostridia bacterium]|nr:cell division protein SepF [Clostridia bacterium]
MGVWDEFKKWARLDVDDEEDDDFEEFIPPVREEEVVKPVERKNNKVVNIHTTTQLQVVLVKPERFETAQEIADHLKDRRTVVLNLESANKETARRILDFLSGVAYAQEGNLKRVANSTYIVTPFNVNIQGDLIDELENSGLYF